MLEQMRSHTVIPFDKIDPNKHKVGTWKASLVNPEASSFDMPRLTFIGTAKVHSEVPESPQLIHIETKQVIA
jgi:hypothetical protein